VVFCSKLDRFTDKDKEDIVAVLTAQKGEVNGGTQQLWTWIERSCAVQIANWKLRDFETVKERLFEFEFLQNFYETSHAKYINCEHTRRLRFLKLGERSKSVVVSFPPTRLTTVCTGAGPTSLHHSGALSIIQGARFLSQYGFLALNSFKSLRIPKPIRQLKASTICSAVLAAIAHKSGSFPSCFRGSGRSLISHLPPKRK
jgi:hypothetical protein